MEVTTVLSAAIGGFMVYRLARAFIGKVAPERAKELVAAGAKLVDVRTAGEHASGHIPGSLNIPVSDLSGRIKELGDKSKPVVVYCASGMRSASAVSLLKRSGFTEVYDLGAGSRWG